jgi:hypothetical protein
MAKAKIYYNYKRYRGNVLYFIAPIALANRHTFFQVCSILQLCSENLSDEIRFLSYPDNYDNTYRVVGTIEVRN